MDRRTFLATGVLLPAGLAGCAGPPAIYSGAERLTVAAGSYERLDFDLTVPATIKYRLEVVEGPNVDVLVIRKEQFERFEAGELRHTPKLSQRDVAEANTISNLWPGVWYLILDNRDPGSDAGSGATATVDLSYEITRYIPFGSGRDRGPRPG